MKQIKLIKFISLFFISLLTVLENYGKDPQKDSYFDTRLPVEKRVEILLGQMTLEEKVAQVCGLLIKVTINEGVAESKETIYTNLKNGIGEIENSFDQASPKESAIYMNRLQQFLKDSTRLKIPALVGSECLHGHVGYNSTIFPVPLAMACSWNPELVNKVFDIAGREARMRGCTGAHTPVLDLGRDPRFGRIEETYGEDTYLVSQMGFAASTGLQGGTEGNPRATHIISSPKHFAGYGQVSGGRNFAPTVINTRMLYDEILPPYEKNVKEANVLGIMASHSGVDEIPAHANKWLLTELLKNKWGFEGIVVSDYYDIRQLYEFHHVARDAKDAAKIALTAGVDIDLPNGLVYSNLTEVISDDPSLEKYLNESVKRILTLKFKLGLFENSFVDAEKCDQFVGNSSNIAVAEEIANESIVLLKNHDRTLPLDVNKINSIAVIGPNAASIETGGYSVKNDHVVSILEGIKKSVPARIKINYTEGCKIARFEGDIGGPTKMIIAALEEEENNIQQAVNLASGSDVAVVCVGGMVRTSNEAYLRTGFKGDRSTLGLLGNQEELINRLIATGKPVIVVLMGGKPYAIPKISEKVGALLSTFYLGQQTGVAVSNVLFGKINPSGKLSIGFPRSSGQLPVYYSQKRGAFTKDYLEESSKPLFAFGYGLSYSDFEFSGFKAEKDTISDKEDYKFSVQLKNTSNYSGAEVVQVYYSDLVASVSRPEKLLVKFKKVFLEPGEAKTLEFTIHPKEDLSFTGVDYKKVLEPGEFKILIGNSSDNIPIEKNFYIKFNSN
jgi:beta-glucosidase